MDLPAGGSVVIGRGEQAQVRIEDTSISRAHAVLHVGKTLQIEDLGSSNGTFLHGQRLEPGRRVDIEPGEFFEIGAVVCVVRGRAAHQRPRQLRAHGYFVARLQDEVGGARVGRAWKPWAVVGGGVAVAAAGLGFELRAQATYRSYDDAIAVLCAERPCADEELPGVVPAARDRARLQHRVGVGLLATGGGVVAAGLVLAILNRPVRERMGYDDPPALVPVVTADQLGVAASWSF